MMSRRERPPETDRERWVINRFFLSRTIARLLELGQQNGLEMWPLHSVANRLERALDRIENKIMGGR